MKKTIAFVFAGALFALATPAMAVIKVMACEPEWAALLNELADKDKVEVYLATNALQDPHHVQARPSLIAAARNSQLIVCTGAELEVGWLPILLRQSGNAALKPGQIGNFEAAAYVKLLEVPTRLNRADGDVHAAGNPHIQSDPRNFVRIAEALSKRLIAIDAANATHYAAKVANFNQRWTAAMLRWEALGKPLRDTPIAVEHSNYAYLENWLGLIRVVSLEAVPGVEPSAAHLSAVLKTLAQKPVVMVLRSTHSDGKSSNWLAERAKIPVITLPFTVGSNDKANDLFGFFDDTLQRLLKVK